MSILSTLRERFAAALQPLTDDVEPLLEMIRPSGDPKFGDYQANCAMPLGKKLGKPPRELAAVIVEKLDVADICQTPQVAGPGFINLRLHDDGISARLTSAFRDQQRLGIQAVSQPRTLVLDYSAPNIAKPMHVGHIRSTVIGDALYRLLAFLGHRTISDNHIGDWGTQFGMILYGFKHFVDREKYTREPVAELGRLYRLVNQLVAFFATRDEEIPALERNIQQQQIALAELNAALSQVVDDKKQQKKLAKEQRRAEARLEEMNSELQQAHQAVAQVNDDPKLSSLAQQHPDIGRDVLVETSKLHAGDPENRRLWRQFMPPCLEELEKTYRRLGVQFDYTLGESFYHDRLPEVVDALLDKEIAEQSDGAICIFRGSGGPPMIVRKKDGAFLYATTDLATIRYRMETFRPDAILYVVDHRQALHFEQLFDAARRWGYDQVELQHIRFGTVLGDDQRPFKTRSGDAVGLSGLLDEAVAQALNVVSENDQQQQGGPQLDERQRRRVAEVVGIGGLKYADLAHHRESDYVFSYEKMLAKRGNTATYMQYAYARVMSIFARGGVTPEQVRSDQPIVVEHPAERALGLHLLRFAEALEEAAAGYLPHLLAAHLFETANRYSTFFEECPVLKAETPELRDNRLRLCDLTARTIRLGLELLGIGVVDKM